MFTINMPLPDIFLMKYSSYEFVRIYEEYGTYYLVLEKGRDYQQFKLDDFLTDYNRYYFILVQLIQRYSKQNNILQGDDTFNFVRKFLPTLQQILKLMDIIVQKSNEMKLISHQANKLVLKTKIMTPIANLPIEQPSKRPTFIKSLFSFIKF